MKKKIVSVMLTAAYGATLPCMDAGNQRAATDTGSRGDHCGS